MPGARAVRDDRATAAIAAPRAEVLPSGQPMTSLTIGA